EGEQLVTFEEGVVGPEDLARHAVAAAEVAAIRDGQAQVGQRTPEAVGQGLHAAHGTQRGAPGGLSPRSGPPGSAGHGARTPWPPPGPCRRAGATAPPGPARRPRSRTAGWTG